MRIDAATVMGALLAAAVGAGIALLLASGGSGDPAPTTDVPRLSPPPAAAPQPPAPPELRGAQPVDATRVEALEETIDDLREELAAVRAELETARRAAPPGGEPRAGGRTVSGGPRTEGLWLDVADRLALEGGRRAAFLQAVRDLEQRIQDLEVRNATRTGDGDKTIIRIASFGEDGKRILRDWKDWVERNLSTEERRRYADQGIGETLWQGRVNHATRTITITSAPDGILTVGDEIVDDTGTRTTRVSRGRNADAQQLPYRHLLPR